MLAQAWSLLSLLHPFLTVTPIEAVDIVFYTMKCFQDRLCSELLSTANNNKKSSLSHRIAIQQHGMRGSIISILPADEMGCFCISQAYTRSLELIPGALSLYPEPWAAYHRPSHASGLSFALPRLSWNCRILSLPTVPRRWRVDTFWPRATEALERLQ